MFPVFKQRPSTRRRNRQIAPKKQGRFYDIVNIRRRPDRETLHVRLIETPRASNYVKRDHAGDAVQMPLFRHGAKRQAPSQTAQG